MAESIALIGVPSKDIVYYTSVLLKKLGQKVLVVSVVEEATEEGGDESQPVCYLGVDWLTCSSEGVAKCKEIMHDYSYIIYEYSMNQMKRNSNEQIQVVIHEEATRVVCITDMTLRNMKEVAQFIEFCQSECRIILRDICSPRFDHRYFLNKYPYCREFCEVDEIWLDSYNQYYKLRLELEERGNYKHLSKDMIGSLYHIMKDLEVFPENQITGAIKSLCKGGVEC